MADPNDQMSTFMNAVLASHNGTLPPKILESLPNDLLQFLTPHDQRQVQALRTLRTACAEVVLERPVSPLYLSRFQSKWAIQDRTLPLRAAEQLYAASAELGERLRTSLRHFVRHVFDQSICEEADVSYKKWLFDQNSSCGKYTKLCRAVEMIAEVFQFLAFHDFGNNHLSLRELILNAPVQTNGRLTHGMWRAALRDSQYGWWNLAHLPEERVDESVVEEPDLSA